MFQRAAAKWVAWFWLGGTVGLFTIFVWSGATERLMGPGTPPHLAAPTLLARMMLFPGIQVASFVAFKLGLLTHLWHFDGSASSWLVSLGIVVAGLAITAFVWGVLVPWMVTAFRVYLWPKRAFGRQRS